MNENRFSMMTYFRGVTRILRAPRRYFSAGREKTNTAFTMAFLIVSAVVYTFGFSMVNPTSGILKNVGISMTNALGMVVVTSVICYLMMVMMFGQRVSFQQLFGIIARASGVTMLVAWVPYFIWLTEPWKWYLIWIGLSAIGQFRWYQTTMILLSSIFIIVTFFYSLLVIM